MHTTAVDLERKGSISLPALLEKENLVLLGTKFKLKLQKAKTRVPVGECLTAVYSTTAFLLQDDPGVWEQLWEF